MMKKYFCLVAVVCLIGAEASAHQLTATSDVDAHIAGAPVPVPAPGRPPVPAPTPPHYSYWKPMWDSGTNVNHDFLLGSWKLIGQATTSGCGHLMKDQSNPNGIKNDDGSDSTALTFADFPTNTNTVFAVQINGLGTKKLNQGPYEVASSEPQFSTWAYSGGGLDSSAYFEWACRNSNNQIICTATLRGITSSDSAPDQACGRDVNGVLLVYSK